MADIQYDPACMDCRHDAVKDPAGTTWQCNGHVRAERDWLRAKLANVMVEWKHDVEVLTKERNAALKLSEQRGAAYDMTWREVESLREWKDKLEAERDALLSKAAPPADAATEAVRMLRHLCNVYGCTSYGRTPDHGPDDCSWCEAEALLAALAPGEKEENRGS